MLHTRTEAIKNESLNDEAEDNKENNDFSNFIVIKDSHNIIIGFCKKKIPNDSRICYDSS